jgi:hypothetical protein
LQGGFRFGLRYCARRPIVTRLPFCKGLLLSISLINAVVKFAPVKGGEYLLLLILAKYAGDDGARVFPSVETMAKDTRQDRRAVQKQLRGLESKGLIVNVGESVHGTINYRIVTEKLSTKDDERGERRSPQGAALVRPGGERRFQRGERRSPDSLDSLLIHQNRLINPKVKTAAGTQALSEILGKLKIGGRKSL